MDRQAPLTTVETLDAVLHAHSAALGRDFTAYRNHTYRVVNLCAALAAPDAERLEKIAVATAFHDLGIWTDGTFDYLEPSVRLASAYLETAGRTEWTTEVAEMIRQHHKIRTYRDHPDWLVEAFRRADWVDVTRGVRAFGVPRAFVAGLFRQWPDAGFHKRLLLLSLKRLRTHPWSPLPMFRV